MIDVRRGSARAKLLCIGIAAALAAAGGGLPGTAMAQASETAAARAFDIPAGSLQSALSAYGLQSGKQLVYAPDLVEGKRARRVSGRYDSGEALRLLLEGTGLGWSVLSESTYVLKREAEAGRSERPDAKRQSRAVEASDEKITGMPAIMVQGARTLNMDITRTEDDPQPYVVFDRDLIERSGASTVEQLLQQKLPMNTSVASMGGGANTAALTPSSTGINLRGLGTGQTLILVDGHRMSSPSVFGASGQGEISGVPLAAVERIEILPSTASGIYGGGATGGVINIITRKDYSGGEVRMTYDNTFSTDSAVRKIDFVFGHNFNQGRTNILLSAGYSDANTLTEADRGFLSRGYAHGRQHNPEGFMIEPPIGRRPNFVSVDGSDLVLKSGASLGSSYASVPAGYGGVSTDGGAALAARAGQYDWELPDGALGLRRDLYAEPALKNAGLVLRHRFNDGLQAFVDLSTSESRRRHREMWASRIMGNLPVDSPYNPFTSPILVLAPLPVEIPNETSTDRDRAVVGVVKQLPADWQMSLDYTWDRTRVGYVGAPWFFRFLQQEVNVGSVDILRDVEAFPLGMRVLPSHVSSMQSTVKNANLRFSGPLGHLPGGRPVLSTAVAHREESVADSWWDWPDMEGTWTTLMPAGSVSTASAYMEYRIPLFSEQNARPGFRELDVQLAARYEKYTSRAAQRMDFIGPGGVPSPLPEPIRSRNEVSSVDPTVALRWRPIEDLALRMSYGTGFLPPSLDQLVSSVYPPGGVAATLSDPRRGNSMGVGPYTAVTGGNPNLRPESSKSWSAGLIFTPSYLPGLRVSVDYTRIEKSDNIDFIPGGAQGVIDREAQFPERVVRGPNLPGDPAGWAGPIIQLDTSRENLANLELEAWDVQLDYRLDTEARGIFDLFLVGTWQPRYATQLMSDEPMVDYVGRGAVNPLEFKANAGFTWNLSAWRAGWNLNYFDSYIVSPNITAFDAWEIANQGNGGRVPSQTYHDVFVNYDFALSSGSGVPDWLSATSVQLGIRNIFNKRPPVDMATATGHAYYSPFGSPRLASYYLTVTTRF